MKQKLLNSFTWRASLLVALLSCAFSAWGQTEVTSTLTFTKSATSYTASDGSVWTVDPQPSYNRNHISGTDFTLSTSSISGTVTSVVVSAKRDNGNNSTNTLTVTVGNETAITGSITTAQQNFTSSDEYYLDDNSEIIISFTSTKKDNLLYSVEVKYIPKATFSISAQCALDSKYYGTYSNDDWAFVVPDDPDDVTVSKVSVSGGILSVISWSKSKIVPKSTGVLVSSESAGTKSVFVSKKTATADVSGNMLHPSSEAMTSIEDYSDYYFYHLTFNDSNPLGFYWGKSDGGAWTFSGTNKAYLAVPKTDSGYSAVKGFTLSDSADGIKAIETEKNSEMVFNLAGQRVSKMQKGIYVVNGKKILVK